MPKFMVQITETLSECFEIEAQDADAAIDQAEAGYYAGEYVTETLQDVEYEIVG